MRRFWNGGFEGQIADRSVNLFRQEIQGFVELGMKQEALRLVRGALKSERVTAEVFNTALDAIFSQADRLKSWAGLIESAYRRLSQRDQRSVRFGMLAFYCGIQNYESASRFVLRRFGGRFGLVDLAFAMRTFEKFDHRVVLLRVGMDSGEGGIQGPLLKNGKFDYLPITDDSSKNPRKYGNTKGRYGTLLINYWPESMRNRYRETSIHHDPEFETFTYGDPTRPKQSLRRLKPGDLLVFYAGLQSWSAALGFHGDPHLYLIGYFVVEIAGRLEDLNSHYGPKTVRSVFANSPHIHESGDRAKRLNLVKGSRRSKLFQKAYLLSEYAKDRNGRRIKVLRKSLARYFGRFSSRNYLQRSPPRWVKPEFAERAHNYVLGLA